ncbi:YugN family protein [Oceanobacillus senegalensis]|uniref:YugN family protein n=1 Tax=Oceanobacillus senegalensis TaxID=1936063 RepID=UPI000A313405|nr:YugN family protein [Oceanobacillus senegalensis]
MLKLQTDIEGIKVYFGEVYKVFKANGFTFCSNYEYDHGKFDMKLCQEGGETIYIRIPFDVLEGELDRPGAYIQFGKPYVIKHVVNIGLDWDENSLLTTTGFNQFQNPVDKDGKILDKSRWVEAGEQQVHRVLRSMNDLQILT